LAQYEWGIQRRHLPAQPGDGAPALAIFAGDLGITVSQFGHCLDRWPTPPCMVRHRRPAGKRGHVQDSLGRRRTCPLSDRPTSDEIDEDHEVSAAQVAGAVSGGAL